MGQVTTRLMEAMKISKYSILTLIGMVAIFATSGCKSRQPKGPTPIPSTVAQVGDVDNEFPALPPETAITDKGSTQSGRFTPGDNTIPNGVPLNNQSSGIDFEPLKVTDDPMALPADVNYWEGMVTDYDFFDAQTVYFGFDLSNIDAIEAPKIETVADHMKGNLSHEILIEGHCDERGTENYNLALGEQRALSIREYLVNLGINPDRVHTISYGEARPADPGMSEEAYAANRRDVFVLLTPEP